MLGSGTLVQWGGGGVPFRAVLTSTDEVRSRNWCLWYYIDLAAVEGAASVCLLGSALCFSMYFAPALSAVPRTAIVQGFPPRMLTPPSPVILTPLASCRCPGSATPVPREFRSEIRELISSAL